MIPGNYPQVPPRNHDVTGNGTVQTAPAAGTDLFAAGFVPNVPAEGTYLQHFEISAEAAALFDLTDWSGTEHLCQLTAAGTIDVWYIGAVDPLASVPTCVIKAALAAGIRANVNAEAWFIGD
jgi:hypothetical protein